MMSNERLAWMSGMALIAMIVTAIFLSHQAEQLLQPYGGYSDSSDTTRSSSHHFHQSRAAPSRSSSPSLIDDTAPLPPLFPLQPEAYVGLGCAIVGLVIAAGGGIGGGGTKRARM
jgi:hypothetical protein